MKEHQPSITIDQQINNLKSLDLIIDDEEYAKKILNDISYFRLIKAYSVGLKPENSNYDGNVTFNHIVDLYLFNSNLRQIIFPQIEKVEVNLRCRVSNYFGNTYGVLGYYNDSYFTNKEYHTQFLDDLDLAIRRNSKSPFVINFLDNYEGYRLPIYAAVEILSFGTLSMFFKNMLNADKKNIAKLYNVGYTYFESWIESISYVRNICAHYGRLYNARLVKKPTLYSEYTKAGIRNNRIFAVLICLKSLLPNDNHWLTFVDELELIIDKYEDIDISTMGFPNDWKKFLIDKQ